MRGAFALLRDAAAMHGSSVSWRSRRHSDAGGLVLV